MTKAPTPTEMSKGQIDTTNNATKKFDKTSMTDRLRTVNNNDSSNFNKTTTLEKNDCQSDLLDFDLL